MDRLRVRSRWVGAMLAALVLVTSGGCSLLPFIAYLYEGIATKAEYDGLKGKRVAVICRPVASLQYQSSSVSRELSMAVADLLAMHVRHIKLIDQDEIDRWEDENEWDNYIQIGKALKADMVVGIDLDQFSLLQGQTLYQGKASVEVSVYDLSKTTTKRPVFQKSLPQRMWPPNAPIPAAEKPLAEFQREFINQLAGQIGRHFYDHDATQDFAADSAAHHYRPCSGPRQATKLPPPPDHCRWTNPGRAA